MEFVKAVLSPLSCGPAEGQHLMWRHFLPVTSHLFYLHTCHSRQQSPDMVQYAHIRLLYLHTCHSSQQSPDMVQNTHLSSVICICTPVTADSRVQIWSNTLTSNPLYLHTCHSRQQSPDMVQYTHIHLLYLRNAHLSQQTA